MTHASENRRPAAGPQPPAEGVLTMLVLCLAAGAVLALGFDAHAPQRSVAGWLLAQPLLALARNLHYWSAQGLVAAVLWLAWSRLRALPHDAAALQGATPRPGTAALQGAAPTVAHRRLPARPLPSSLPSSLRSSLRSSLLWPLLLVAALLSGHLMRGDDDAREVLRLLGNALAAAPWLAGARQTLQDSGAGPALYALHVGAAAALAASLALAWRRPRRRARALVLLAWAAPVVLLALFVSPGLHDGIDARLAGPWFFAPLQPLLQRSPGAAGALLAATLLLPWVLWVVRTVRATRSLRPKPTLRASLRRLGRGSLALAGIAYLALCASAQFLAAEDGPARLRWPGGRSDLQWGWVLRAVPPEASRLDAAIVRGRPEGCRACHAGSEGFDRSHRPETLGCAACHGGDPFTLDGARAHRALERVPGNLAGVQRSCGQGACHAAIAVRVERSIMTTMAGVISADRRVLGEPVDAAAPPPHAARLGHSAADSHLRELCVSCHLGQPKTEWGPIGQESRGGGCNACHLVYGAPAAAELARYLEARPPRAPPRAHPGLTVDPGNAHCFGCHSRSSRISTNYEGWHELNGPPPAGSAAARLRKLDDGRLFLRMTPDVHHERGLECIDCHVANELMGSGATVARKSEQLRIACTDCHARRLAAREAAALDAESRTLLALRGWAPAPGQRLGVAAGGDTLVNVFVDAAGRGTLRRKRDGQAFALAPPRPECDGDRAHARLACTTCHSAWASRCTSCHTEFDPADEGFDHVAQAWVQGTWNERSAPFEAAPPTLGVVEPQGAGARGASRIDTFVPGMILTFDRNREAGKPPEPIFRRLYGLTFAHTIRREVRSCRSCHADPVALGWGSGTLRYEIAGARGRWRFTPREPPLPQDGLPADAWTGFLQPRRGMVSAQPDMRPLDVAEQQRVLRVGACLSCHAEGSAVMRRALADFDAALAARSRRCVLPDG